LSGLRASLGNPRHPMQVLATLRGLDFDHALLLNVPEIPVALLTVAPCITVMHDELASRPWITTIVMDRPEELPRAFEDAAVGALNHQIFRELLTFMMEDPKTIPRAIRLILVARFLERVADHATNIAEMVVFMVDSKMVRHTLA
jgi:hypothetical protein